MKLLTVTLTVALSLTAGFVAGARNEYLTHAYKVHSLTGTSYLQIVSPLAHEASAEGESDEVCGENVPCEANQE